MPLIQGSVLLDSYLLTFITVNIFYVDGGLEKDSRTSIGRCFIRPHIHLTIHSLMELSGPSYPGTSLPFLGLSFDELVIKKNSRKSVIWSAAGETDGQGLL